MLRAELQDGHLSFPTLSSTLALPSKAQQLLRQRKKMAKQEVNEVMKFDDAFDMAKIRAIQRTAAERKMLSQLPIQVGNSGSPMCVRELLGLRKISSASLFSRRKSSDSLWGSMVLSKIPGSKEEAESEKIMEGRRKSSIKQSFNSFGDVVVAAQAAARKDLLDSSPRSVKGGESRRNSLRRGSIAEETVARLLRRSAFNNVDLKDQFELKEILDPPAPAEMYTRFKVEDISSFPASEQDGVVPHSRPALPTEFPPISSCNSIASELLSQEWFGNSLWTVTRMAAFDRVLLSLFSGGGLCGCCKPETSNSVAMDILQLKSYQDEWDRTQRAIELAKREQVAKEAEIRQKAASRAAELLAERGDLEEVKSEPVITMNL
eukprot:s1139_g11.t1